MKLVIKPANQLIVSLLTLCAFFGITARVNSQTVQLTVDPSQTWIGYMTAVQFNSAPNSDIFAEPFGTAALQAYFAGTNLFLLPNTNVWETTDTTYVQANGETPNAMMDANMYVQNDALINTNLTFSGICLSNTLTTQPEPLSGSNYTSVAVIKAFSSNYSSVTEAKANLVGGQPFSVSLNTAGAAHIQYGFETVGPDANPATVNNLGFVVIAEAAATILTPTNAAATPTNTLNVVAMYDSTGVYPEVPVDDWNASWGDAVEASYTIPHATNVVLKYSALEDAGVEFYDPIGIDTAGCNEMHVDIWTPNANQLGIDLVSLDNSGTQGAQVDITPASGTIVSNQWIHLNIPLSQFLTVNPTLDLTNLQQLLWIDNMGGGVTGGTFYIDNVYFYSNAVAPPPPPPLPSPAVAAPTPTTNNVLALYNSSGVYGDAQVFTWDAPWSDSGFGMYTVSNTTSTVLEYISMQYAGAEYPQDGDEQLVLNSYNTMHVDIWTPIANQFAIQLVSLDNNGTQAGQVAFLPASKTIASNQWVSLNIPLSEFTAPQNQLDASNLDLSDVQQSLWVDNLGGTGVDGGTFYIDNVYFYNASVPQASPMSVNITNGTVNLSFSTESAFNYALQYTTNLTNPSSWQTLTSIGGNDYMQTVTDTPGSGNRFYRLSITQ